MLDPANTSLWKRKGELDAKTNQFLFESIVIGD